MIFGIPFINWLIASTVITGFEWVVLYLGFLLNLKKPVNISMYFQAMFKSYKASELRGFWKGSILGIEYVIGILLAGLIKSAWYPAQWTRKFIGFVLFSNKKKDRLEKEKLADKPKKKKDNGGVY